MTDEKGQSRGFGFVHFEREEAAKEAINKVNGMRLADKVIFVGPFVDRMQRQASIGPRRITNLFIKNFATLFNDETLTKLFEPFGTITSCVVCCSFSFESENDSNLLLFAR